MFNTNISQEVRRYTRKNSEVFFTCKKVKNAVVRTSNVFWCHIDVVFADYLIVCVCLTFRFSYFIWKLSTEFVVNLNFFIPSYQIICSNLLFCWDALVLSKFKFNPGQCCFFSFRHYCKKKKAEVSKMKESNSWAFLEQENICHD